MTDLVTAARQYETGDAALIQLLGALADEIECVRTENARLMHDIEAGSGEIERLRKACTEAIEVLEQWTVIAKPDQGTLGTRMTINHIKRICGSAADVGDKP